MLKELSLKIRRRETPFYQKIYALCKLLKSFETPVVWPLYGLLRLERTLRLAFFHNFIRIFYNTPLFKMECRKVGKRLYLVGGIPLVMGHLRINLGDDVTLFGATTLIGAKVFENPTLTVGNNTYIGYQLLIDVGCDVTIGNNVLIADRVTIRSYDGHPTDPSKRHLPAPPESSRPISIEDNAWIGQDCIILKGVSIGAGSIVGAGTVVTKDVPPNSLAVGNPVRCIPLKMS
jgi:acetyltransferase-like isoleucine patch superfamily enzyme